jgi:hypothetical protein
VLVTMPAATPASECVGDRVTEERGAAEHHEHAEEARDEPGREARATSARWTKDS